MSEEYDQDFDEEIEEDIVVKPDPFSSKKPNKANKDLNGLLGPQTSKSSNMKGTNGSQRNISSGNKNSRGNLIVKSLGKSTKAQKNSDDDDVEENIRGRYGGDTPPNRGKKKGLQEFDLERYGSKPRSLLASKDNKSSLFKDDEYKDLLESTAANTEKALEMENNKLRASLKEMNDKLSKFIDNAAPASFAPQKKVEFKYKSLEEKERVIGKEIENNERILEISVEEYNKLKERVDQVKDPEYVLSIEEKTEEIRKKIDQIRKSNVKLNLVTAVSGKNLDSIENEFGLPPSIREANTRGTELAILKRKLEKLKEKNEQFDKERDEKTIKAEELQSKHNKLITICESMRIPLGEQKRKEQYQFLLRQVKQNEDGCKFLENNNEKYIKTTLMKEIQELVISNEKEQDMLNQLEAMIEQQKNALRDMVEQEEGKEIYDRPTKAIINKIKVSLEHPDTSIEHANPSQLKHSKRSHSGKPPKDPKKDIYEGLPLFSPSRVKDAGKEPGKDLKNMPTLKKSDFLNEKKSPERASSREKPTVPQLKPNVKPTIGVDSKKNTPRNVVDKPEVEQKPAQEVNPTFSKPNLFKKNPKKPEDEVVNQPNTLSTALSRDTNRPVENSPQKPLIIDNKKDQLQGEVFIPMGNNGNNTKTNNEKKAGNEISLPEFLGKAPLESKKNEQLKLSDEFAPKKKEVATMQSSGAQTNQPLTLNPQSTTNNPNKAINEPGLDESLHLGGVSRVKGRNRAGGDDVKASTEFGSPNKNVKDPFAQFDNVTPEDLVKDKKLGNSSEVKDKKKEGFSLIGEGENKSSVQHKQKPSDGGLFGVQDDDFSKVQVRKGPRDRLGGKENMDNIFGVPDAQEEKPSKPITNKPSKVTGDIFGGKDDDIFGASAGHGKEEGGRQKKKDDLFENDIFGNEQKKENRSRVRDDPFAKKDDDIFGSSIGNNEKPKEKFSLLGSDEPSGGIGKQPRKMKGADTKNEKELASKAEKGGGAAFFDGLDVQF